MSEGDFVFILEMMIQTLDGIINEPIGVFSTEEEAQNWLEVSQDTFKTDTVVFNVIPVQMDRKPPILEISENATDKGIAYQLIELYNKDVFEQMVEPDGSFSYQLKDKYKKSMETAMSRRFKK